LRRLRIRDFPFVRCVASENAPQPQPQPQKNERKKRREEESKCNNKQPHPDLCAAGTLLLSRVSDFLQPLSEKSACVSPNPSVRSGSSDDVVVMESAAPLPPHTPPFSMRVLFFVPYL
jgi:hypothetical protein